MRTDICDLLGIEIPLLAFSHCRDVVVEVSKAGGFGVLGGSSFAPEDLKRELTWIDENVDGKPYGVDIVLPEKLGEEMAVDDETLLAMVPAEHRRFVQGVLAEHGIELAEEKLLGMFGAGVTGDIGERLMDVILRHPVKLVANALGVPPAYVIERAHAAGLPVAALVGAKEHAIRQVEAGVDVVVVQGTEAGGHCGEVTTMVLVPEVVRALRERDLMVPVLAAGGIVTGEQMAASVVLGAAGAWTGSVWLTTHEAETAPWTVEKMLAASSRDTVRSRARTGKPSRQLRTSWHAAWEREGAPQPLPMPLQSWVSETGLRHVDKLAETGHEGARELATYWVGQGVGLMDRRKSARDVVIEMATGYADATERLAATLE
ncbi:nitronate monooxygenase [Nocardioides marmoriginsengisoli]|uniref:Nitronate monooxygenase n=1 Tax=Nocardioides marmoriginsengisoli TaxID=661483 RepID=A0A3N0CCB1_9ACTN|nr:nitronate monooxygenase [Nocardioides marmoriginsengisoli]RNL61074.1 nitronate monooxygenase [Nocardioides marmoriginsengisoli]